MSDWSMPIVMAAPRSGKNVTTLNWTPRMAAQEVEAAYWAVRVVEYRRKSLVAVVLSFMLVAALSVCLVADYLWPSVVLFVALAACVALLVSLVLDWRSSVEFRDLESKRLNDLLEEKGIR
ncbi:MULTISPECIES: hypothetical protein [Bifidobacterium]|uniref:hypothetical protein n=1 Tax=Bifidobacterium TaxID=1678 RepID=UPI00264737F6|nr:MULTISPECIES: hypothetical protein [Bifidobacterium]MDN5978655.1 hypothetical protein [Bifidobacterium mongoliense]MDN6016735.1 hypothetical protein [Bifidobacterium mongoliense]MDN6467723.1 hypothetical protein [Bifidobacterium crudilactis]MDN6558731.1 hypothetical protein [Bifidobacterium crudilactis]MDN6655724.1 hypothetical protein [Bifidobacterium crudilactis]